MNVLARLQNEASRSINILIVAVFALAGIMPILVANNASAATLTSRSVAIADSTPGKTGVTYTFNFSLPAGGYVVRAVIFQFCDSPLGTCTLPGPTGGKMVVAAATTGTGTLTGFTDNTAFTETTTDTGACTEGDGGTAATMYCLTRAGASTNEAAGAKTIPVTAVTNPGIDTGPTVNNTPVYVRISTFSNAGYTSPQDSGVVAASIVKQLTVSGRVQERLVFCVFALNDAAGSAAPGATTADLPQSCASASANAGTNVDLGVVDNATIARSPVDNNPPSLLGNDAFGAAMVNTNAAGGVNIGYFASDASSGTNQLKAFRVPGAACNSTASTIGDQCFVSASTSGETITAGTEKFGMQLSCVVNSTTNTVGTTSNLGKTAGTYTFGSGAGGSVNSAYDSGRTAGATFDDTSTDDCENLTGATTPAVSQKYAWNTNTTVENVISADTVVDNEIVKFRYGATASATTPTGSYTVASTFVATATF